MSENKNEVTLLLVEDDDVDAMAVQRSFQKMKISNSIVRARDGIEALALLTNQTVPTPYIVLLDLNMPRMNGIEFLETVRKTPEIASSVIFVLTTSDKDEDIISSYKNNIAGYFLKQEAGKGFIDLLQMLEGYWRIAHLPDVK